MPKASAKTKSKTKIAPKARTTKKPVSEKPKTRQIKAPTYKSFRLSKRIRRSVTLARSFTIFKRSIRHVLRYWRLFGGLMLAYLVLNILLVKGLGVTSGAEELQEVLLEAFKGNIGQIYTSLTIFGVLLGNISVTPTEIAGAYQTVLLIIFSLALIWALRQTQEPPKQKVTFRDALYKGMYPLVPFMLIILVIGLQLTPILLGTYFYGAVIGSGLTTTGIEATIWYVLIGMLVLLALYMVTSSIFALYIVTLPNFTPLSALRAARGRVLHRRLQVMVRLLFLPFGLVVTAALIVVPVILVSPIVAEWLFYILSVFVLAVVHSYMFNLYRELIKE